MKLNLMAIPNVNNYAIGSDWLKLTKKNNVIEVNIDHAFRAEDIIY